MIVLQQKQKTDVILGNCTKPHVFESRRVSRWKRRIDYSRFGRSQRRIEKHARIKIWRASSKVVIEEFLDGIELSCFVLTDGKTTKYYQLLKITNALARNTG
jgi:hypothetical protein